MDTFWAGTQNLAGLNAFQVFADGSTAFALEILYKLFGNTGRAFAIRENACHHDSANQGPASAFHAAHPGSISRRQLHQRFIIKRKLVLKHFDQLHFPVAFSSAAAAARSSILIFHTPFFQYTTR